MKNLFFTLLLSLVSFFSIGQNYELYSDFGDCINNSTKSAYLIKNIESTVSLDFKSIPDSIKFTVLGVNSYKTAGKYNCIFTSIDTGKVTIVAVIHKDGLKYTVSKSYIVIEKPNLDISLRKVEHESNNHIYEIVIIDLNSNQIVTTKYKICFYEYLIFINKKIMEQTDYTMLLNISKLLTESNIKFNRKYSLKLKGIRLLHKEYNRSFWYDK